MEKPNEKTYKLPAATFDEIRDEFERIKREKRKSRKWNFEKIVSYIGWAAILFLIGVGCLYLIKIST